MVQDMCGMQVLHRFSERLAKLESAMAEAAKFSDAEAVRAQQTEALVTSLLAFKETQAALSGQFDGAFAAFHSLLTEAGIELPQHWRQLQIYLRQLQQQPGQKGKNLPAGQGSCQSPAPKPPQRAVPRLTLPSNTSDSTSNAESADQSRSQQSQAAPGPGPQAHSNGEALSGVSDRRNQLVEERLTRPADQVSLAVCH